MSGYKIPFHILEEIMKRLPVKSLIQFRSVSKAWNMLITSSTFITAHSLHSHTQPKHLLVWTEYSIEDSNYVCYIDDDTFPKQRSLLTLPLSVKQLIDPIVLGISRGLICLYEYSTRRAVVWNPSIRKSIVVSVPDFSSEVSVGFGVCSVSNDPKIIAITQSCKKDSETSHPCTVMVYTLISGKWRNLSIDLCVKPLQDCCPIVASDGFIYWRVGLPRDNMVISFDVTNEVVEVMDLSDILGCKDPGNLYLSAVRESITMLEYKGGDFYAVWMMEHGAQKLFTKVLTINTSQGSIVGFRRYGVPMMQEMDNDGVFNLLVYEPNLEDNSILEFCRPYDFFKVNSYVETLLLLGRSDCSSY